MIRMYSVEKVLVLLVVRKVERTLALALARPPLTHQLVYAVLCFSLRQQDRGQVESIGNIIYKALIA